MGTAQLKEQNFFINHKDEYVKNFYRVLADHGRSIESDKQHKNLVECIYEDCFLSDSPGENLILLETPEQIEFHNYCTKESNILHYANREVKEAFSLQICEQKEKFQYKSNAAKHSLDGRIELIKAEYKAAKAPKHEKVGEVTEIALCKLEENLGTDRQPVIFNFYRGIPVTNKVLEYMIEDNCLTLYGKISNRAFIQQKKRAFVTDCGIHDDLDPFIYKDFSRKKLFVSNEMFFQPNKLILHGITKHEYTACRKTANEYRIELKNCRVKLSRLGLRGLQGEIENLHFGGALLKFAKRQEKLYRHLSYFDTVELSIYFKDKQIDITARITGLKEITSNDHILSKLIAINFLDYSIEVKNDLKFIIYETKKEIDSEISNL
ncbi:MAG: hypothetical protein HQL68_03785 [Magnetococcales bacterium]|nr:hypothetical protein [Magnetococcales bacterium]